MMHRFWITFTKLALFILICWSCNLSLKTELRMSDLKQFNWLAGHTVQAISSYTCANEYGQWKRQQFRKKYQFVKSEKYEKKIVFTSFQFGAKMDPRHLAEQLAPSSSWCGNSCFILKQTCCWSSNKTLNSQVNYKKRLKQL